MSNSPKSYTQFELFPVGSKKDYQPPDLSCQTKHFSLSLEHIVGICIVGVVSVVVSFCLGVQKGQKGGSPHEVVLKNITDNLQEDAIIVRSEEPEIETVEVAVPMLEEVPQERVEILEIDIPEEVVEQLNYTIQVASFKREKTAQKEALNLKKQGYDTSVLQKGQYSIVCVGKFAQAQEAKKFSKRLKNRYKDCLVRRL